MMKEFDRFKLTRLSQFCLMSGMAYVGSSLFLVHAQETDPSTPVYAEFNSQALIGSAKDVDITQYSKGNPIIPGDGFVAQRFER